MAESGDSTFGAFVLTADKVRELDALLKRTLNKITYRVRTKDGITDEFTLEALVQYPNLQESAITKIEVKAWSADDPMTRVSMTFGYGDAWFDVSILTIVFGSREHIAEMRQSLTNFNQTLRPAWAWLTDERFRIGPVIVVAILLLVFVFVTITYRFTWQVNAIVLSVFAWLSTLSRFYLYIFPPATFAIGDGIRRSEHLGKWRAVVVVSLGIGIVASIVAALLLKPFN